MDSEAPPSKANQKAGFPSRVALPPAHDAPGGGPSRPPPTGSALAVLIVLVLFLAFLGVNSWNMTLLGSATITSAFTALHGHRQRTPPSALELVAVFATSAAMVWLLTQLPSVADPSTTQVVLVPPIRVSLIAGIMLVAYGSVRSLTKMFDR